MVLSGQFQFDEIHNEFDLLKVESTIMQMYHQRINFHAKGLFVMNFKTMLQVI